MAQRQKFQLRCALYPPHSWGGVTALLIKELEAFLGSLADEDGQIGGFMSPEEKEALHKRLMYNDFGDENINPFAEKPHLPVP